jgi:hypothetical protein
MKLASLLTIIVSLSVGTLYADNDRQESDRGVEGTLRSTISDRHVHIHVHHGVVTLDGKVRTEADRQRIEQIVRDTAGVVAVKDKLKVTLPTTGEFGPTPAQVPVQPGTERVVPQPSTTVTVPAPAAVTVPPPAAVTVPAPAVTVPAPSVTVPAPALAVPAPVVVPENPKLKVQPTSSDDQLTADRIAGQLKFDAIPSTSMGNVTVTVSNGAAAINGCSGFPGRS